MVIKALVLDIDNTLTESVSWLRMTEVMGGSVSDHQLIFDRFLNNITSYEESKQQLLELWQATGNANRTFLASAFNDWPLRKGAHELTAYALDQNYQVALITGSMDLFAQTLAERLHVPHWYANTTLHWSDDGNLVDLDYIRDQAAHKLSQLQGFAKQIGADLHDCVVVGDGHNDVDIFRATGRGIALGPAPESLRSVSHKYAATLAEVQAILQSGDI